MKNDAAINSKLLLASSILMSVGVIFSASAQTVPSTARPGVVERQYRIQDDRPAVSASPVVTDQQAQSKPIKGDVKFTLKSINFTNLGVFNEGDLAYIYQDKIGTTITLNELNAIVDQVTAHYRNNGYILSRAILPPQRIESGNVTIRIVEGYVNTISLQGDVGDDADLLNAYASKIQASKPLHAETLERYLLLMEDLPGVVARAVLTPAEEATGASDVIVTISRKPIEFSAHVDNRGSRFLGPVQAGVTGAVNNLFGRESQTELRVINSILQTEELKFVELRHEEQVGTDGLKFVASASYVETQPGSSISNLNIDGSSTTFTAGLTYPILRSRQSNWFVDGDITSKHTDVDALNANLYEDELRIVNIGTSYDFLDSLAAVNRLDAGISQGFNLGTGADNGQPRSRINGETNFTKFSGQVSRLQPIDGPWSFYGIVAGQYSMDPLLASEEFVIGGPTFGSAYDSAEITGDHGLASRFELQYSDNFNASYLSQYQLYTFYDIGKVWNRDIIAASETNDVSIASTGLGARFNITESVSGGLEAALPLTKNVSAFGADGDAPRAFFNLQYRY